MSAQNNRKTYMCTALYQECSTIFRILCPIKFQIETINSLAQDFVLIDSHYMEEKDSK